ncbi:MAG: TIGR00268 family protein, partial [Oscillospiraceae bacterium]|nr:TIGR00268 family protein [Oscillospiraceae bacterium]
RIAGLFTWSKPAYACLATRTATGTELTAEGLEITERAEGELAAMGFRDFRIRTVGKSAKIQVKEEQLEKILACRELILEKLAPYYDGVTLDLEVR